MGSKPKQRLCAECNKNEPLTWALVEKLCKEKQALQAIVKGYQKGMFDAGVAYGTLSKQYHELLHQWEAKK